MADKQRLYLLRVDEQRLPPGVKNASLRPCRTTTNIALRNDDFQPCVALGELPACDRDLVIWAACTNHAPVFLLKENLGRQFAAFGPVSFIHALDTAVMRRQRDGLLCALPDDGQFLVADLRIKDVEGYLDQQYQEYQQRHEEEARFEEMDSENEEAEQYDGYLDAWEEYQAEDDIEETGEGVSAGASEEPYDFEDGYEAVSSASAPVSGNGAAGNPDLARLRQFVRSTELHGDPAKLHEAREGLDRLLEQWQFSPSSFTLPEVALLRQLMRHYVFQPRKAHCFKCKRHLYDHLDRTCLQCLKYQIICSDPNCGVCGCKHDPSFARK